MADFEVHNAGSIVQIKALTNEMQEWIDENVEAPAHMWLGGMLCVESAYADDLIDGMMEAGFEGEVS